jgi:hypothetical protein
LAPDRLHVERDPVQAAIARVVDQFLLEALARCEVPAHARHRRGIRLRALQQVSGHVAYRLCGGDSGQPGERVVDPLDMAVGIGDHHGVAGSARHEGQLAQLGLGVPVAGDVGEHADQAGTFL